MNWEQALRQRALDDAAIAAIVGTAVDWGQRTGMPALTLLLVSDPRGQTLAGFEGNRWSRVQVDARALSRPVVVELREAAIAALVRAGTFHGVRFGRGQVADPGPRTLNEQTETGFVHRDSFDLIISHD